VLRLKEKLGPILWQYPAQFTWNPERLESFFSILPRTQKEAARLARRHDERLNNRSWLRVGEDRPLRHAIEIRHESFVCQEFIDLLRKHNIGLVVADAVEWPLVMDVTSDFVYCRMHGSEQLYASGYESDAIGMWARRVVAWAGGGEVTDGKRASAERASKVASRDVYIYFDNDAKVRAPFDAMALQKRITER